MEKKLIASIFIALLAGSGGGYVLGYAIYQPQMLSLQSNVSNLQSELSSLSADYNTLNSTYNELKTSYEDFNTTIWEAIYDLQSRVATLETTVETLEARIRASETPTKITIEAYPTTDIYLRSHGLSIDEPLPDDWWLYDYEFKVTGSVFTYVKTVYLGHGSHYVEYAASGYVPDYAWHARIYINDVLKAEGDVGRHNHLRAYFDVGN